VDRAWRAGPHRRHHGGRCPTLHRAVGTSRRRHRCTRGDPRPRSIKKRAEEPAQRVDGGHQKRSDTQSRSRKERDKAARPSAEQARQEGRVGDDSRATDVVLGEEVGARGHDDVAETRADGDVLPDTDEPQSSTSHDDDTEAPPSTEGDDKPVGQAD